LYCADNNAASGVSAKFRDTGVTGRYRCRPRIPSSFSELVDLKMLLLQALCIKMHWNMPFSDEKKIKILLERGLALPLS